MAKVIKYILTALTVFLLLILQTTWLRSIEIFNVMPNVLLISVICYSLCAADVRGVIYGIVCGFLLDITGGRTIGINTLLCTYVSFVCVLLCDGLYNNNEIVAAVFTAVITFIYGTILYVANFLIWGKTGAFHAFALNILPETIYNTIVALFVYPLMHLLVYGPRKNRSKKRGSIL